MDPTVQVALMMLIVALAGFNHISKAWRLRFEELVSDIQTADEIVAKEVAESGEELPNTATFDIENEPVVICEMFLLDEDYTRIRHQDALGMFARKAGTILNVHDIQFGRLHTAATIIGVDAVSLLGEERCHFDRPVTVPDGGFFVIKTGNLILGASSNLLDK